VLPVSRAAARELRRLDTRPSAETRRAAQRRLAFEPILTVERPAMNERFFVTTVIENRERNGVRIDGEQAHGVARPFRHALSLDPPILGAPRRRIHE
jgi:hypothetical protein